MPFQRKAGVYSSRDNSLKFAERDLKDYGPRQSGLRRHQFTSGGLNGFLVMAAGAYGQVELLTFRRTFSGAADDVEPTPTASNNFQTTQVMNGSYISRYRAVINIENSDNTKGTYLDVYEVQVSFWDVFLWNSIFPTQCPYTFDNTGVGPPDTRGFVAPKAITSTLIVENTIKNHKFLQHFIKHRGTIYIGALGQDNNKAQVVIDRVPPKVRRSNNGMHWGLLFHNNSDKNGALGANFVATCEYDFDEIPSSDRIEYLA